jgi:hypothetical protein
MMVLIVYITPHQEPKLRDMALIDYTAELGEASTQEVRT